MFSNFFILLFEYNGMKLMLCVFIIMTNRSEPTNSYLYTFYYMNTTQVRFAVNNTTGM
jgi:hypothetical protein